MLIMAEETVAHMREQLTVPPLGEVTVLDRVRPQDAGIAPADYLPYGHGDVPPMAVWGDGYNMNHVSLVHHPDGNVTRYNSDVHFENVSRIKRKIADNVDEIAEIETRFLEGCRHLMICYGSVSRTGVEAVLEGERDLELPNGIYSAENTVALSRT